MYQDLHLKFTDEAQAQSVFPHLADTETPPPANLTLDVIGIIHKPTGVTLQGEDGGYPEMAPIPGFHVNVRMPAGTEVPELLPYAVVVDSPMRVWA